MSEAEWRGYRLLQEDVWFFRDARPSIAGADHYLRSIFPPFPSTLYGLVRTQRLLEEGVDLGSLNATSWPALPEKLRNEIGEWDGFGTLALRGPWFLRDDEILLPAPLDLRVYVQHAANPENDRVIRVLRLLPIDNERKDRNWSHALAPMSPFELANGRWEPWRPKASEKDPESSSGWFVSIDGMRAWRSGGVPACEDFVPARKLWIPELRTGVGLDPGRRKHEEHQLYTFGFARLRRGVSLGFELSGGELETGRTARFGGENRVATIEAAPTLSGQLQANVTSAGDRGFVATLLTPAIFAEGTAPAGRSIVSAVVPGPLLVGGWDLANRRPKPLKRGAPPGAVYWIDEEAPPFLGSWSEKAMEGFGVMLSGDQPRRNHG